ALRFFGAPVLRCVGQLRHAAIRWIDDERRSRRGHLGATVPPEVVVGTLDVGASPFVAPFVATLFLRALLESRHLLAREELPARDVRRPLERRDGPIRERALQIGFAPGRSRRGSGLWGA